MDFPFHEVYKLNDYRDDDAASVFFGCYRYEDEKLIRSHRQEKIIFWTGQDALDFGKSNFILNGGNHVTAHPKVYELLEREYGDDFDFESITLIKPAAFGNKVNPQKLGTKIYAYCPSSAPDYHGKKILDELSCGGYEVVIGDGQFTRQQWKLSAADFHYNQSFIGLCLSEFAGGGESIIEMGLRGMKVVTNVFDLPNCVPWNSIHDIVQAIEDQTQYIGHTNPRLAQYVWDALDHKQEWLNL